MAVTKRISFLFLLIIFFIFKLLIIKNDNTHFNKQIEKQDINYKISLGGYHSSFLFSNHDDSDDTNTLYMWGNNFYGQIGDGTILFDDGINGIKKNTPKPIDVDGDGIKGNEKIIDVNLGGYHSSALLDNGDGTQALYMWGNNVYGQLGNGKDENSKIPIVIDIDGNGIAGDEKIIDVELGEYNSSAILLNENNEQELYLWGNNSFNQVDSSSTLYFDKPLKINSDIFPQFSSYLDLSLGDYHLSVLIENVNKETVVYSWGKNNYGQLGIGNTENQDTPQPVDFNNNREFGDEKVLSISANNLYSSAIVLNYDFTKTLYMWGNNFDGQIGDGTYENKDIPTPIDINNDEIVGNENILSVSLGLNFCFALIEEEDKNSLYTWGNNAYGQLGNETVNSSINTPILFDDSCFSQEITNIALGKYHSSILINGGEIHNTNFYMWGRNNFGQVGNGLNEQNINNPVEIDFLEFNFSMIQKNQESFVFQSNKEFDISDKKDLKLIDNSGEIYDTKYNLNFGKDRWTTFGLLSGKKYYFDYLYYNDEIHFAKGIWSVLTDYEINKILDIKLLSNNVNIIFDINTNYFKNYSEDEKTIKFDYSINDGEIKESKNFIISENKNLIIEDLEFNSKYTIEKIYYNFNNESSKFKYDILVKENNIFEIKDDDFFEPKLIIDSFELVKNLSLTNSFKFNIKIVDIFKNMNNYEYIYLFANSNNGSRETLIFKAYKVNKNQFGSNNYEFEVSGFEELKTYEIIGISLNETLDEDEMFSEVIVIKIIKNTIIEITLLFLILLFLIFIYLFLFINYKKNKKKTSSKK